MADESHHRRRSKTIIQLTNVFFLNSSSTQNILPFLTFFYVSFYPIIFCKSKLVAKKQTNKHFIDFNVLRLQPSIASQQKQKKHSWAIPPSLTNKRRVDDPVAIGRLYDDGGCGGNGIHLICVTSMSNNMNKLLACYR